MLVPISIFLANTLRYGAVVPLDHFFAAWPVMLTSTLATPIVLITTRLPWIKISAFDVYSALRIACAAGLLGLVASLTSYVFNVDYLLSIPIIFAVIFFTFSFLGHLLFRHLAIVSRRSKIAVPVAIFGAGSAGLQLASFLRRSDEVQLVCFFDDDPSYNGLIISFLRVYARSAIKKMVETGQVQKIFVALPSIDQVVVSQLINELSVFGVEIQTLPSIADFISGRSNILTPVSTDALLGRNVIDLDIPAVAESFAGRVVMVTGAGGSIGSELCSQLLECRPKKIVLFEQCELALYNIEAALTPSAEKGTISLIARLGSVCNQTEVENVMRLENVEVVLHAAAYKHVPLVEKNEVKGAENNVLGTKTVAEAALRQGVERFILISTDKAVRPTSVMGATKRMAELVLQDIATRSTVTRFSTVRFGNVLGSSGSVIPLFQKQIRGGGPVTVTHTEVTRFFMTIPEAARLVLLAGAFSKGADVFVLDMGSPMNILEIAKRMIAMSGGSIRSPQNPNGIEIVVTGLRPGEKLYEELLIDDNNLQPTPHVKILRAVENGIIETQVVRMIKDLENAVKVSNCKDVRNVLTTYVEGYTAPESSGSISNEFVLD
jgi:FlaA1/EpsC-like NDP-sugar epimerase